MKPSKVSLCFLFPPCICCLAYAFCTYAAARRHQWMALVAAPTQGVISDSGRRDQEQIDQVNDPKLSPPLTSSAWHWKLSSFYFSAVSCCQFNTLHVRHKEMSPGTAEEHREWKREGRRQKRAEMTTCHILWHKDNGRETWLSNPHQNSCSTWPWNRVCALWTLKNLQKMYNYWIMKAGWKKNQTNHQNLLTALTQTSKQERCTFHTRIYIPTNWRLQPLLKHEDRLQNAK